MTPEPSDTPPATPEKPAAAEEQPRSESRLLGVSVPGWATLLAVGTVCMISLVEGVAVVIWSITDNRPLADVKIPDALYQLATMALGFYLGRKAASR